MEEFCDGGPKRIESNQRFGTHHVPLRHCVVQLDIDEEING